MEDGPCRAWLPKAMVVILPSCLPLRGAWTMHRAPSANLGHRIYGAAW